MYIIRSLLFVSIFFNTNGVNGGFFTKRGVVITGFHYNDCLNSLGDKININKLSILSSGEGDIVVSGSFSTNFNISSPLKGDIYLTRSVLGIKIPMPCFNNMGSCKYADLCNFGVPLNETCPAVLEENDVPCRCPFQKGDYELPDAQFPIGSTRLAGMLAGTYSGILNISKDNTRVGCFSFRFKLQ